MRILLDENFPYDFSGEIKTHDVLSVHSLGWTGTKNGELLRRAVGICDVFVTLDRNLEFQQNIKSLSIAVIVLRARSNRMVDLLPLIPALLDALRVAKIGEAMHVK
jgi:Domain of unknown function (DUF5615)